MKTFTKEKVETRFRRSIHKPTVVNEPITNNDPTYKEYSHRLFILIPGPPIADNRVRFNTIMGTAYNSHKASLMKIFGEIYKGSILENICILGPVRIEINVYKSLKKVYLKTLDKKSKNKLDKELLLDTFKQDNDNLEKIHWDVLQDLKHMIILQDEMITTNITNKFSVIDDRFARVEINIYYNTNQPQWIMDRVKSSSEYYLYTISAKYLRQFPTKDWKRIFYTNALKFWKDKKSKRFLNRIQYVLEKSFTTSELYYIGEGKNKNEVINQILKTAERMMI